MAYNNYYPQFYQTPQSQYMQQQSSGITWVQGENSAKSYPVAAGQSILLMDSESPVMYIKSTDQSGVPLPLRVFDYKERSQSTSNSVQTQKTDYISRNEFDAFRNEIRAELRQFTSSSSKQNTKQVQNKREE